MQLSQPSAKKKKGGGLASWLGQLQLVKAPNTGSWYDKQSISGGSSGGYNPGESYSDKGKSSGGTFFDKLINAKG